MIIDNHGWHENSTPYSISVQRLSELCEPKRLYINYRHRCSLSYFLDKAFYNPRNGVKNECTWLQITSCSRTCKLSCRLHLQPMLHMVLPLVNNQQVLRGTKDYVLMIWTSWVMHGIHITRICYCYSVLSSNVQVLPTNSISSSQYVYPPTTCMFFLALQM